MYFPTDKDWHGIVLYDELNRATREVQQAAMESVLDYRQNMVDFPEHCRIASAINDDTDNYSVLEIDPALLDRFLVINFRPITQEWIEYAKKSGVHDAVIKYIMKHETSLDCPETMEPGKVYPSRRSWVKLSKSLRYFEKNQHNIIEDNKDYFVKLASGYVGSETALSLEQYITKEYKVLTAKDILNSFDKKKYIMEKEHTITDFAHYNKLLLEYIKDNGLKAV
jgi:hypothetical protein